MLKKGDIQIGRRGLVIEELPKYHQQRSHYYWCPKPIISHETESKSETNEGFASETKTE